MYLQSAFILFLRVFPPQHARMLTRGAPEAVIQEAVNANDAARFLQVRQSILNACTQRSSPASKNTASRGGNSAPAAAQFTAATIPPLNTANAFPPRGYHSGTGAVNGYAANSSYGSATSALSFRPSPFYKIETLIGTVRVCDGKLIPPVPCF